MISKFFLFSLLLLSQTSFAQLTNFSLQVTATNETCTANGSLSFTVSNTAPGAIIIYRIFKSPDFTTPIAVTNTNNYGGLTAGSYQVVAIQSVGNLSNTQSQVVSIINLIVPVTFHISSQSPAYCGQTGMMTILTDQGNPVAYEIISGPVLFPPQASNMFFGLPFGDYDVRVIDACGDGVVQTHHLQPPPPNLNVQLTPNCSLVDCNTKSVQVVVNPLAGTTIGFPLVVELTVIPPGGPPLVLTQTITSGNTGIQDLTINLPYNIAGYIANIRVIDGCNHILTLNGTAIDMAPQVEAKATPVDSPPCAEDINIGICNMVGPYMVTFLEAPAGFIPSNFNPGNLGPFNSIPITYASSLQHQLPEGHYSIQITDACGRIAADIADIVRPHTDHKIVKYYVGCDIHYMVFIPDQGVSPVTITLTSAPAGYPGPIPINMTAEIINGHFSMELPIVGTYVFTGINACGDTYIETVEIIPAPPIVRAVGNSVSGCVGGSGTITITLEGGPPIASVVMISAPPTYTTHPLPYNVSAFIDGNICVVNGLVIGDYSFIVTDVCGTVYPVVIGTVHPSVSDDLSLVDFLRGCDGDLGSMRMRGLNGRFVQVIITSAPANFLHPLPYDVSFNINPGNGFFYMNTLPHGDYIFHTKDICGVEHDQPVALLGNDVYLNIVDIIGNCGSFNLFLNHRASPPTQGSFWLQKFNPLTNGWEHPITGVPYPDGTPPTNLNSYALLNIATNYNIASLGTFRVLKVLDIYSNGNPAAEKCYITIKEFEFTGELKILSTSAVPCSNGTYDVVINVSGIAPFIYRITTKDGLPFVVNNGNSNLFSGLASGIYNFQMEDACGNIVNRLLDITTLTQPSIFASTFCAGQNGQLSVQAVSFLSYEWWKAGAPGTILSNTNVLNFSPFSNTTSPGTYFVRIYSTSNLSCINMTISYVVPPSNIPNAGLDATRSICGNPNPVDLFTFLGAPFDSGGTWTEITNSGGTLTASTWSPSGVQYGSYSFLYQVSSPCGDNDQAVINVNYNPAPANPVITAEPSFCTSTSIQLQVDTIPNATYHWTGPNNFSSDIQNPVIPDSSADNSGQYVVTATVNGCESNASVVLHLLPSPDYTISSGCVNNVYTVSVKAANNSFQATDVSYSWSGPNGFTSSENPIQLDASGPGLYQVVVTNSDGCSSEQSVLVPGTLCTIPNVITPNDSDSINQTFDLSGLDVVKLEIYSRWGRLVYEHNNYLNEWYGQNMHGKELPDSTYYYIIYLRASEPKQGWVYKTPWK